VDNAELARNLEDPEFALGKLDALLHAISANEVALAYDANEALTYIAAGLGAVFGVEDERVATFLKCAVCAAYILGRRDGTGVPDAFKDV
jgi:hypothetical protein